MFKLQLTRPNSPQKMTSQSLSLKPKLKVLKNQNQIKKLNKKAKLKPNLPSKSSKKHLRILKKLLSKLKKISKTQ